MRSASGHYPTEKCNFLPIASAYLRKVDSLISCAWFSILEIADLLVFSFFATSSWVKPASYRASRSITLILNPR